MKPIKALYAILYVLTFQLFSGCIHEEQEVCETPYTFGLLLEMPPSHLPDHTKGTAARNDSVYDLRCVVEVFRQGTDERITRLSVTPAAVAGESGLYSLALTLRQGAYDLRLWADYVPRGTTDDYHYATDLLTDIGFNPAREYTACTDSRHAAYATRSVFLTADGQEEHIVLQRPLAKYRIVATDLERYRQLIEDENYPPLDELTFSLSYDSFLSSSFDVTMGTPNDASTGISYNHPLSEPAAGDSELQLGSDWLLSDNKASFVRATLSITDRQGHTISRVSGIRVNYLRGHLTTIRGSFLTAGQGSGKVTIDTTWEGEYIVTF